MTGPVTPILDNFNRTENPVTGWTALNGSAQANGTTLQANSASTFIYINTPNPTASADCEAYIRIPTVPNTNNSVSVVVRGKDTGSIATFDGYQLEAIKQSGADTIRIMRLDNAVASILTNFSQEYANGDGILLRAVGSRLEAEYYNGTSWSALGSTTDTTYAAAGALALGLSSTNPRADDFGGGALLPFVPVRPGRFLRGIVGR